MLIRPLVAGADLAAVREVYRRTADYWTLAERRPPDPDLADPDMADPGLAARFFTACPPGCDPMETQRLGLEVGGALSGLAELSFGYPGPGDGYLGLMILVPEARGQGLGAAFLAEVEARARRAGARALFLAVLEENPRGRAFWAREGFLPTGVSRTDETTGHVLHRLGKPL